MAVESQYPKLINTIEDTISFNVQGWPPLSGTKTETFAVANSLSRKRPRESMNMMMMCPYSRIQNGYRCGGANFTFLCEDLSSQIQQQQLDTDRLIAQHSGRVRMEIEERRKRHFRRIVAAVEQGLMKRLKAKDDEIEKIRKLNFSLEGKVQSLSVEGQIWQDLALTNEAQAQSLRATLDHILTSQALNEEDNQSCCGSSGDDVAGDCDRMCRQCGEGESRVLLLPCRHLCLCLVCGTSVNICPVCKTAKHASVHVIMCG